MKTHALSFLLALICLWLAAYTSCTIDNNFTYGEMFMVECDGAVLPVLVHGNVESGVFLIRVHGGPGGYSIASQYTQMDSEELDWATSIWNYSPDWGRNVALVDYDQRGAGTAQGNALPEQFTLDQFVEDLDAVVDTVRHLYRPTRRS